MSIDTMAPTPDVHAWRTVAGWAFATALYLPVLSGCKGNAQPAASPPPEVAVIEARGQPVTVFNEYVARTQSPDTIEIRSQVTGLLERQAFADRVGVRPQHPGHGIVDDRDAGHRRRRDMRKV